LSNSFFFFTGLLNDSISHDTLKQALPKNQLQNYCQKRNWQLPVYRTRQNEENLFLSEVRFGGQHFVGQQKTRKKDAEIVQQGQH
jgi:dsRNA-specific ribonuclease